MECDTLSDLPEVMHNPAHLNEAILAPLRAFVGPVFTGLASQAYGLGDLDWGVEIKLNSTETIQMRIYPRGLLSAGNLMETRNRTIMVAVRRRGPTGKDHVALGILWHGQRDKLDTLSPFDSLKTSTDCVATRNLHIFLPSLSNHHDAMYANRSHTEPEWPILDTQNFHAVRPGTYSVHSLIKLPSGDVLRRVTAAPGHSQYVIAGHLAGVEIEDHMHPSVNQVPQPKWVKLIDECSAAIENKVGLERGLWCMDNSMQITDSLTAEGLLAVMAHNFSCGAMPDMLHLPCGFPLLIAFMVRLACYPKRFHLPEGHAIDQMANNEVISLFESNWEPIHPQTAGERNIYAIDVAIRQAHTEARNAAKKLQKTEAPVEDNTTFWHRAGQRCVSAVFGAGVEEFVQPRHTFGLPQKLVDPLVEARNSVIQKKFDPIMAVTGTESVMSDLASVQERRNCLIQVLNSVEHWLRTGSYCGLQINEANRTPSYANMRIKHPGGKNMLTRDMLREALDKGVDDSVKQLVANGEANTVEEARAAAKIVRDDLEGALQFDADDRVGFEDVVCEAAMTHAVGMVCSSMCSGAMVQLDLEVGCFLSGSTSLIQCADCESEVHLLTATFLATNCSRCVRCNRPRCLACSMDVHTKRKAPFGCLRCKASDGSEAAAAVSVDACQAAPVQHPAPTAPPVGSPEKSARVGKSGKAKGKPRERPRAADR